MDAPMYLKQIGRTWQCTVEHNIMIIIKAYYNHDIW